MIKPRLNSDGTRTYHLMYLGAYPGKAWEKMTRHFTSHDEAVTFGKYLRTLAPRMPKSITVIAVRRTDAFFKVSR